MRPIIFLATAVLIFVAIAAPFSAQAVWVPGNPVVPCGNTVDDNGKITDPCNFSCLVVLGDNIVSFFIYLAVLVAVAMFAYAGFLYLTSVGDVGKMKSAHTIFTNAAYGFIFVLGAWLLVSIVVDALAQKDKSKSMISCAPIIRDLLKTEGCSSWAEQCANGGNTGGAGGNTGGAGGNTGGTSPLIISSAPAPSSITTSGAVISWSTNQASNSIVDYGLTTSYGSQTFLNNSETSHSVSITGLAPNTTYHYRVSSRGATGNPVSSPDYTFTTPLAAIVIDEPPPNNPPVLASIIVTPSTATINIGDTQTFTVAPKDQNGAAFTGTTVTWSSSNSNIVAVNQNTGVVTAIAAGSATITATASATITKTDTSTITVNSPPPCVLTSASWNSSNAVEGQLISFTIHGNNCRGKQVNITVYEDDTLTDELADNQPSAVTFDASGTASGTWTALWKCDSNVFGVCLVGNPEYYFINQETTGGNSVKSGNLSVSRSVAIEIIPMSPLSIPTNANAICLYNSNDATSAEICNYYLQKRPGASKLGLDVPDAIFTDGQKKEFASLLNFVKYVKKPLDDYVVARPELKITHVAIAKELPIRIAMEIIPPLTDTSGNLITHSHMSNTTALEPELDYSLCPIIDESCSKKLYNRDNRANLLPDANNDFGPYWRARNAHLLQHFAAADYQSFRLGMRPKYVSSNLNGYNLADIKKMIDRAQATPPDLRSAKWVVDGNATDMINNDIWEEEFATAHKFLSATAGIPQNNLVLEKTNVAPLDLSALGGPVVGYYGFGTHHPNYFFDWALRLVKAPVANRAVITAYESYNGDTFSLDPYTPWSVYLRVTDNSYFSKPPDFISSIAFGGTDYSRSFSGGYGNVYEPNLPGADHAEDFFLSYASGMTLAEAFFNTWESPNNIAWGDPLMRITDSTDNSKPNGLACADNSECRPGSQCLADDLGFKFCFTPENGSCLFARPRDPTPELRLYNISAPNGGTICEDAPDGKSTATLACSNSQWRRTACAPGGQCGYTTTPNVYYDYLAGSFAGANCQEECSLDADCSNGYCDADMNGVKRCHTTASACVSGLEAPSGIGGLVNMVEVPTGVSGCATDQGRKAQCNNAVWSGQTQCQDGCIFGSCLEEFYNAATQTFNLLPQRSYLLTFPINIGSKMISEVFANPVAGTKIRIWDKQAQIFGVEKTYSNGWSGGDIIIKSGDAFKISVPANYSFKIKGTEFNSALPFSVKSSVGKTSSSFGMPYCAEEYTASKLLREISARDNRCAMIRTYGNGVDPILYWSEVENSGMPWIKQDFQILPFEGYFIKCAEGVDFTFTPTCSTPR